MNEQKIILIADDSSDDILLTRRALKEAGISNPVHVARDGEEAMKYLAGEGEFADREKHPYPTVLCLDIHLPRRNGVEVLRWMREGRHLEKVTVVILAGNRDLNHVREAYALGAFSFLTKPIKENEVRILNEALRRSGPEITPAGEAV